MAKRQAVKMRELGFKCHRLMCFWMVTASACVLARADVSSLGDISPVPDPNGGSIVGTLTIGIGNFTGDVLVGSMRVSGGTALSDTDGIVGRRFGAIGVVAVDGTGSLWTHTDDLTVGDDGIGELQISSSGRVNVRDDMFIGNFDDGQGVVGIGDGHWCGIIAVIEVERVRFWKPGHWRYGEILRRGLRGISGGGWVLRFSGRWPGHSDEDFGTSCQGNVKFTFEACGVEV